MKILVTGKTGQLGFELQRALAPLGEIIAVDRTHCDLAKPEVLRNLIQQLQPDIIVNPAAYTAVDKAETEIDLCHAINGVAPGILGEEAAKIGALVIHYSTDYVFDGIKESPYTESDAPNPQGQYGKSKLAGEQALMASGAKYLIFRTSWVVGAFGGNFAKTMLRLAGERDSLRVVADQYGAPTGAALIADVTAHIIVQYRSAQDQRDKSVAFPFGIYHLTAKGSTSWHGYAQFVVNTAVNLGKHLRATAENIEAIPTSAYPLPAPRPANSHLDSSLLEQKFNLMLPHWQSGVKRVLQLIC